jgi:hypothetical protein
LILDVHLLLEARAREVLTALAQRELDLLREVLVLRVELVELAGDQVLRGLDTPELSSHFVDYLVDLAHRLRHRGLRRRVFNDIEERVHASTHDAGNSGCNVIGHSYTPFRCLRSAEIRSASSMTRARRRSMAEGS